MQLLYFSPISCRKAVNFTIFSILECAYKSAQRVYTLSKVCLYVCTKVTNFSIQSCVYICTYQFIRFINVLHTNHTGKHTPVPYFCSWPVTWNHFFAAGVNLNFCQRYMCITSKRYLHTKLSNDYIKLLKYTFGLVLFFPK